MVQIQLLMKKSLPALLLLLLLLSVPRPVTAQEASPTPEALQPTPAATVPPVSPLPAVDGLTRPVQGEVLSGLVNLSGTASGAWDLAFAYPDDTSGTYFPLASSFQPITGDLLSNWDTSQVSDGEYRLRLRISTQAGSQEYYVNFQIRNDQPPTDTPTVTPTLLSPTPFQPLTFTPAPSATELPTATPTPLPPNPVILPPQEIAVNFGKGAAIVTALFAIFGLLLSLSRKLRA
jgi:hypothetical protein